MDFGRYVFADPYFGWLCRGVLMTLVISLASGTAAALLGLGLVRLRLASRRAARTAAAAFVTAFRNLPLVPLLLFLTFGLPNLWSQLAGSPFPRGLELLLLLTGLSANTGAYFAEILRAGVSGVAPQHHDVARTMGLSTATIRWYVVYPQAVRIVAPALATRWIHNMKNSAMALVVPLPLGMMEVVGQAGRIAGETFSWVEPLIVVAAIHLLLSLGAGYLLNRWASRAQARVEARPTC
jgi:His/Glu/Gln/Arg/opine family amino acid ABC transporter permease subunit